MPGRPPRARRALVAALSVALLALPAAVPAVAATPSEIAVARERVDRLSAELLQARSAAERLGGGERAAVERLERRLQRQKDELVRLESGLEARHRAEASSPAADGTDDADGELTASPSGDAGDGPVVLLGDPPADDTDDPATTTSPSVAGVVPLPDERRPAVVGDDATMARQIDGYLASKASPLTGLGAVFVTESRAVGMDPRFLVAIAGSETSFGTYGPSQTIHNPFGMGPHIVYASWSDGIRAAAQNLGGGLYKGSGLVTIPQIQGRWAPNGATNDPTNLNVNWTRNVGIYYAEQGGDPGTSVFTSVPAAPAAGTAPAAATGPATGQAGLPVVATTVPVITPEPQLGDTGAGPEAAQSALEQLGTRTVASGASPTAGFDAGGLVSWAYRRQGVTLPRDAVAQSRVGEAVEPADLEAGDAVFFSDPSGMIEHVGLYLGDGQFVHAAGPGETVTIGSLYEPYHAESYAGARRY